ncbi:hypothetical protein [Nocardia sp.]|uniref:hypothetical protein n=1 Tax=Nocardia sp. TaxID=1821 RepID=UPI0026229780|nr:hypothetical protein [Nocardia sp.]
MIEPPVPEPKLIEGPVKVDPPVEDPVVDDPPLDDPDCVESVVLVVSGDMPVGEVDVPSPTGVVNDVSAAA